MASSSWQGYIPLHSLPFETLESILRHLRHGNRTLQSFALTARAYRSMNQKLLFEKLYLPLESCIGAQRRIVNLVEALNGNDRRLLSFVKDLHFRLLSPINEELLLRAINSLFALLTGIDLRLLYLESNYPWNIGAQATVLPAFEAFLKGTYAKRLTFLHGPCQLPARLFISWLPDARLDELVLVGSSVEVNPVYKSTTKTEYALGGSIYLGSSFIRQSPAHQPRRMVIDRIILINSVFTPSENVLPEIVDMGRIKALCLNRPSSALANVAFEACKESVELIVIHDDLLCDPSGFVREQVETTFHSSQLPVPKSIDFDFNRFTSLTDLTLYIHLLHNRYSDTDYCSEAMRLLGRIKFSEASIRWVFILILTHLPYGVVEAWAKPELLQLDRAISADLGGHKVSRVCLRSFQIQLVVPLQAAGRTYPHYVPRSLMPYLNKAGIFSPLMTREISEGEMSLFKYEDAMGPPIVHMGRMTPDLELVEDDFLTFNGIVDELDELDTHINVNLNNLIPPPGLDINDLLPTESSEIDFQMALDSDLSITPELTSSPGVAYNLLSEFFSNTPDIGGLVADLADDFNSFTPDLSLSPDLTYDFLPNETHFSNMPGSFYLAAFHDD